jgi:hypothetical protein
MTRASKLVFFAILATVPHAVACGDGGRRHGGAAASPTFDVNSPSRPREITTRAYCASGRGDSDAKTLELRAIIPIDWVLVDKADPKASETFRPHTRQFWDVVCTGDACEGVMLDLEHVDEDGEIHAIDVARPSLRVASRVASRLVLAWGPYRTITYDDATRKLSFVYSASDEEGRGEVECK